MDDTVYGYYDEDRPSFLPSHRQSSTSLPPSPRHHRHEHVHFADDSVLDAGLPGYSYDDSVVDVGNATGPEVGSPLYGRDSEFFDERDRLILDQQREQQHHLFEEHATDAVFDDERGPPVDPETADHQHPHVFIEDGSFPVADFYPREQDELTFGSFSHSGSHDESKSESGNSGQRDDEMTSSTPGMQARQLRVTYDDHAHLYDDDRSPRSIDYAGHPQEVITVCVCGRV